MTPADPAPETPSDDDSSATSSVAGTRARPNCSFLSSEYLLDNFAGHSKTSLRQYKQISCQFFISSLAIIFYKFISTVNSYYYI